MPTDRPRSPGRILSIAGLVAAVLLFLVHAGLFRRYVNDDAFITFRYSRALASGLGPYYNPGEHVEGYTNFLLMALLAPVVGLAGEDAVLPVAKLVGVAAGLAGVLVAAALVRRLLRSGGDASAGMVAALAAGLVAASPFYAANSASGLETTLFGALLAAGVLLSLRAEESGGSWGSGIAFALAALTRPEGALLFAVFAGTRGALAVASALGTGRSHGLAVRIARDPVARRLVRDAAVVGAVVGGQLAFRFLAYDGEWLPNTYWAKAGGFWGVGPWGYVRIGAGAPLLGVVPAVLGFAGFLLDGDARRWGLPLGAVALAGALSPLATGTDWMPGFRLVAPYLPLLAAVVAIGWYRVARLVLRRPVWIGPALLLALVPLAWFSQGPARAGLRRTLDVRASGYDHGHRALAEWLRSGAARPGDTVALMDIGIVGFFCHDQRILDITGLTDRTIAKSPGTFLDKRFDPRYVLDRKPEFVVLVLGSRAPPDAAPPLSSLRPWTPIEGAILAQSEFRRDYVRPPASAPPGAPWTDDLARRIGAERIFRHDYPGRHYLLAVFRRGGGAAAAARFTKP